MAPADLRAVDRGPGRLLLPHRRAAPGFPPNRSIKEAAWKLDEIERELRAQLDAAKRHLPQAAYTWYTWASRRSTPRWRDLAAKLTKEYGLVQPMDPGIKSVGRVYESKDSGAVKAEKLAARLETLEPGLWLHIDHPATNDPEIQAMGHVGYEWVAADRSANLEMWTSPKVREVIERRGIKLTNYRELTRSRPRELKFGPRLRTRRGDTIPHAAELLVDLSPSPPPRSPLKRRHSPSSKPRSPRCNGRWPRGA